MDTLDITEQKYICLYVGHEGDCPFYKMKFSCKSCIESGDYKFLENMEQRYADVRESWSKLFNSLTNEPELEEDCKVINNLMDLILGENESEATFNIFGTFYLRELVEEMEEEEQAEAEMQKNLN